MSGKLRYILINFLGSGWKFSSEEQLLKHRFHLINSIFLVAFAALIQGIVANTLSGYFALVGLEVGMIFFFFFCIYLLRRKKEHYDLVTSMIAFLVLVFFNALILFSELENIKFIWLFFYVVTFMFLKGNRVGSLWIFALFASLIIVQLQPFYPSYLTFSQTYYLIFVMAIVMATTYFFQLMIDRGYETILHQNRKLEQRMATIKKQEQMMIDQSRLAAMGEMIRMIAHQWRQPLSSATLRITNHQVSQMLRHEAPDEKDRLLSEISETLVYLSNTIDDFQSYFKPASQVGSVDVKSVIEQAMEFTAPRARHKKISMHLTCNDGYHVRSNANELIQVLLNLFNNAIDSIVEKDSKLREIVVDVRNERRKIIIAVRDSGGGIPPTVLERLFEPYCSTKGKNGTGLGLYMVKMIVEKQFGGTISGYNIEGGAEFLLTLERSDGVIGSLV